jgi:phosphoglycerate dehydrogenase-like enzyme
VVRRGVIGTAVVERLAALGMAGWRVDIPPGGGPPDEVPGYDALHDALARTDSLY